MKTFKNIIFAILALCALANQVPAHAMAGILSWFADSGIITKSTLSGVAAAIGVGVIWWHTYVPRYKNRKNAEFASAVEIPLDSLVSEVSDIGTLMDEQGDASVKKNKIQNTLQAINVHKDSYECQLKKLSEHKTEGEWVIFKGILERFDYKNDEQPQKTLDRMQHVLGTHKATRRTEFESKIKRRMLEKTFLACATGFAAGSLSYLGARKILS